MQVPKENLPDDFSTFTCKNCQAQLFIEPNPEQVQQAENSANPQGHLLFASAVKGIDLDIVSDLPSLIEKHCLENKVQDILFLASYDGFFHGIKTKIISNKVATYEDGAFVSRSKLVYKCLDLENDKIGC